MDKWKKYRRKNVVEMRPYIEGEDLDKLEITVSSANFTEGSPKDGDMIARDPNNHSDKWLVPSEHFQKHFEQLKEYRKNRGSGYKGVYTPSDFD